MDNVTSKLNEIINSIAIRNSIVLPEFLGDLSQNNMVNDLDFVDDLNFDSLLLITMVVEVERTFGIELPDDTLSLENLKSYKKIHQVISSLVESGYKI